MIKRPALQCCALFIIYFDPTSSRFSLYWSIAELAVQTLQGSIDQV